MPTTISSVSLTSTTALQRQSKQRLTLQCCLQQLRHKLVDNTQIEVLYRPPIKNPNDNYNRPPLIFLHGSAHAAWCYEENFLPYFSQIGYPSYALSFRGQGGSDAVSEAVAGTTEKHAQDVAHFVQSLSGEYGQSNKPVMLGHSFGGYILQQYLSDMIQKGYPKFGGAACLCSVPPSGNKQMVSRFVRRDLGLSLRITWAFATKSYTRSIDECRYVFFSDDLDQSLLEKYFDKFKESKEYTRLIDLRDFGKKPPLTQPSEMPRAFVLGATDDKNVDQEGVQETADWFKVKPVFIENMNHDVMLDTRWPLAAESLQNWLQSQQF